jgi:hypothetical protein
MIRPELKKELDSIIERLDESVDAERATASVLLTLLAAIELNQEVPLMDHVCIFTQRLVRAIGKNMASRN